MKVVLDHVGIAIGDLSDALAFYSEKLGLKVDSSEEVSSQGVRVHFLGVGSSSLELIEAMSKNSSIGRYVERKGPGLHHICFRVDDIQSVLDMLSQRGVRLIDTKPRLGAEGALVAFVHPSSVHGVLVELKQERGE